jgi:hypothetical protein
MSFFFMYNVRLEVFDRKMNQGVVCNVR